MKISNFHVSNKLIEAVGKTGKKAFKNLSICLGRTTKIINSYVKMGENNHSKVNNSKFYIKLHEYGSCEANVFKSIRFNFIDAYKSNSLTYDAPVSPKKFSDEHIYDVPRPSENIKKIITATMRYPSLQKAIVSCVSYPAPQNGILSEAISLIPK
ncbi:hypothetical protein [Sodalis sp. (in: enterobacteria)]|uniref:hypothetical protein n=1 Tax=Sodalis sp. (in: enterobacteria) TaxID=1898979 RepID=UPI003F382EE8